MGTILWLSRCYERYVWGCLISFFEENPEGMNTFEKKNRNKSITAEQVSFPKV